MTSSIFVINISQITKTQYRIVIEAKTFKVKIFRATHKSMKKFSLGLMVVGHVPKKFIDGSITCKITITIGDTVVTVCGLCRCPHCKVST